MRVRSVQEQVPTRMEPATMIPLSILHRWGPCAFPLTLSLSKGERAAPLRLGAASSAPTGRHPLFGPTLCRRAAGGEMAEPAIPAGPSAANGKEGGPMLPGD